MISKHFNLSLLVVFLLVNVSFGAVYRTKPSVHEDHPGKCYHKPTNTFLAPGESYDLKDRCEQITCQADFSLHGAGCGSIGVTSECEIVPVDLSKPYPKCCPTVRCRSRSANLERNELD